MRPADHPTVLVLVPVVAAAFVFHPILGNYFYADDFGELYRIANFGAWEAILAPSLGHLCILRNTVTAVLYGLFGMHAAPYFALVLLTHLANVVLLFLLVRRTTASAGLACLGALLFGISPMHVETLGWYGVYGHVLACSLVLLAFLVLVPRSSAPAALTTRAALSYATLMLGASQSFGTGTVVALVSPLLAELIRPGSLRTARTAVPLVAVPVAVGGLAAFIHLRPSRVTTVEMWRVQMALSMAQDNRHVFPMAGHLLAMGATTLLLGVGYPVGRYPDALSVAVPVVFGVAVLAAACRSEAPTRGTIIACVGVVVGVYGVIAAGRATLTAMFRPNDWLAAVVEKGRYHYLAQAVLAYLLCLVLAWMGRALRAPRWVTGPLLAIWGALALGACVARPPRIEHWDAERQLVARLDATIREQVLRSPAGATVCIQDRGDRPTWIGWRPIPGWAGAYLMLHGRGLLEGRRVLFATSDPSLLALQPENEAVATLLRSPDECPGSTDGTGAG